MALFPLTRIASNAHDVVIATQSTLHRCIYTSIIAYADQSAPSSILRLSFSFLYFTFRFSSPTLFLAQTLHDFLNHASDTLNLMGKAAQEQPIHILPQPIPTIRAPTPQPGACTPTIHNLDLGGSPWHSRPRDLPDRLDHGPYIVHTSGLRGANGPDRLVGENDRRIERHGCEERLDLRLQLGQRSAHGLAERAAEIRLSNLADAHQGHHTSVSHSGGLLSCRLVRLREQPSPFRVVELHHTAPETGQRGRHHFARVGPVRAAPERVLRAQRERPR